jgi:hypothetical protein
MAAATWAHSTLGTFTYERDDDAWVARVKGMTTTKRTRKTKRIETADERRFTRMN